jgi:hypothetical protein
MWIIFMLKIETCDTMTTNRFLDKTKHQRMNERTDRIACLLFSVVVGHAVDIHRAREFYRYS